MRRANGFTKYNKKFLTAVVAVPLLAVLMLSTPTQAAPEITFTPTSGAIGTEVTINGAVFDSYKGDNIYIFFDDTEITENPLTVDEAGTFTLQFNIPGDTTPGRHWIEARRESSSTDWLARSFFIVEEAGIEIDVADGPVGTAVTISGKGFYAGKTVTLYYYNIIREQLGTKAASPTGEFTYHFTVPSSTAGEHKITATNAEGNSGETFFEVFPSIALNLTSAGPGELLTIRGSGFGYKSEVDIYFGIYQVAKVRTDENGNFEVKFNIPEVKPNPYDVKAQDEDGNIDKVKFIATAGANLSQSTGSVGTKLTVRGSGFKIGETVNIDYDDNFRIAVTTDNDGAFTTSFAVPASSGGEHVITVSDGETTKQFAFTVESEAPPVPHLLLPSDSSETRAQAYLDWHDVTDLSLPVTYSLQVASDQNFSSLVLENEGLTDSEYTLSEEERLVALTKFAPYYWRVKATDSANNESEWSDPWSFYTGSSFTLPAWVTYTLIGIIVIVVGYIAFRVGRRTALNPPE